MNAGAAARSAGPAERLMAPWELHQAKTEQAAIWHSGDLFDIDPLMVVDQMQAAARRRRQMGYSL